MTAVPREQKLGDCDSTEPVGAFDPLSVDIDSPFRWGRFLIAVVVAEIIFGIQLSPALTNLPRFSYDSAVYVDCHS